MIDINFFMKIHELKQKIMKGESMGYPQIWTQS